MWIKRGREADVPENGKMIEGRMIIGTGPVGLDGVSYNSCAFSCFLWQSLWRVLSPSRP